MRNSIRSETVVRLCLMGALCASADAAAQTVYKSTMPDGSVLYAEKPARGAAKVETIEPPPPKSGIGGLTPEEKSRAEQLTKQRAVAAANAAASQKELEQARNQLRQAEAARDAGKEPLPTERIGIVGGGTRLTQDYFARQKKLEEAVAAARKQLAETERTAR